MRYLLLFFVCFCSAVNANDSGVDVADPVAERVIYSDDLKIEEKAKAIWQDVNEIYNLGLLMPDMSTAEKARAMHINQLAADIVRAYADELPLSYLELKAASVSLRMCVSMMPSALEQCEMVKLGLDNSYQIVFFPDTVIEPKSSNN